MNDEKYIEMETNTGKDVGQKEPKWISMVLRALALLVVLIAMVGLVKLKSWTNQGLWVTGAEAVVEAVEAQYERNSVFGLQSDESTYNIFVVNSKRESLEEGPYSYTGEDISDLGKFNFIGTSEHELIIIGDTEVSRTKGYATELEFIENVAKMADFWRGVQLVECSTEQNNEGKELNKYVFNIPSRDKYLEAYKWTDNEAAKLAAMALDGLDGEFIKAELRVYFTEEFNDFEAILVYTLEPEKSTKINSETPQSDTNLVGDMAETNEVELLGWDLRAQTTTDDWELSHIWYGTEKSSDVELAQQEYSRLAKEIGESMVKREQ